MRRAKPRISDFREENLVYRLDRSLLNDVVVLRVDTIVA